MRLQAGFVSGRREMDFAKSDLLEANYRETLDGVNAKK